MKVRPPLDRYRLTRIDHPVPLRMIDSDGTQYRDLSRGLSALEERFGPHGRTMAASFVRYLNVVATLVDDAAGLFLMGINGCRRTYDKYLKAKGARIEVGRDGSNWVRPKASTHAEVSRALLACGALTSLLAREVYGGSDPSKVDPDRSRLTARRPHWSARNRAARYDVDRYLRIKRDPGAVPRFDDPRVHERWIEGLRRIGAPGSVILSHELAHSAGNRFCQGRAITLYDLLVASERPGSIPAVSKGSGGERVLELVFPRALWDAIISYVDGERRRCGGLPLASLRRIAADPRRRDRLMLMPLFTTRAECPLTYDRLYRISRRAAVLMDLFINDEDYTRTGIKRYVTFHMQRHGYVHERLDEIEDMPKSMWDAERRKLIAYMGWADGDAMLRSYSAHHSRKNASAAAAAFSDGCDRLERAMARSSALDAVETDEVPAQADVRTPQQRIRGL